MMDRPTLHFVDEFKVVFANMEKANRWNYG
jgi:hypothetical protein